MARLAVTIATLVLMLGARMITMPVVHAAATTCKGELNFLGLEGADVELQLFDTRATVDTKTDVKHAARWDLDHGTRYWWILQHGGMTSEGEIQCAGADADENVRVASNVCTVSLRFANVKADVTISPQGSTSNERVITNRNGGVSVHVLRTAAQYEARVKDVNGLSIEVTKAFTCNEASVTVNSFVSLLKSSFPGVNGASVSIARSSAPGTQVYSVSGRNGSYYRYLLDDTYTVTVSKGNYQQSKEFTCADGTCVATASDKFSYLAKIQFPGVNGASVEVKDRGATPSTIASVTGRNGGYNLYVLPGIYDVTVTDQAGVQGTGVLTCGEGEACQVADLVALLKVQFPGVNGVAVTVQRDDNVDKETMAASSDRNGSYYVYVMRLSTVRVTVTKGSVTHSSVVDCSSSSCTASNFVSLVKVAFSGVNGVDVVARKAGTSEVAASATNRNGGYNVYVLKQRLDVTVSQHDISLTSEDQDCDSVSSCSVKGFTSLMKIKFPGINGVAVEVSRSDLGGVVVRSATGRNGSYYLYVLKSTYKASITWKGFTDNIAMIDCSGAADTCEPAERSHALLYVKFPGVNGASVTVQKDTPDRDGSATDTVLSTSGRNGGYAVYVMRRIYEVTVTKHDRTKSNFIDCRTDEKCTISNYVGLMRARFPGVNGVSVDITDADSTSYVSSSNRNGAYYVYLIHGEYTLTLTWQTLTATMDFEMLGDTADIINLSKLVRTSFHGTTGATVTYKAHTGAGGASRTQVAQQTGRNHGTAIYLLCGYTYDIEVNSVLHETVAALCDDAAVQTSPPTPSLDSPTAPTPADTPDINLNGVAGITGLQIVCDSNQGQRFVRTANLTHEFSLGQQSKPGDWSCVLTQGAAQTRYNFTTVADTEFTADLSGEFADLSLNGLALSPLQIDVSADGELVVDADNADDSATSMTLTLLRGTYDVQVSYGPEAVTLNDVDCTGATCSIDVATFLCAVTVTHTGLPVKEATLVLDETAFPATSASNDDQTVFVALHGSYDISVLGDAGELITDTHACSSDSLSVSGYGSVLTLHHADLDEVSSEVQFDGTVAASSTVEDVDSTQYTLLRVDDYDATVQSHDSTLSLPDIDCSSGTCSGQAASVLTTTFTGVTGVAVNITQGGELKVSVAGDNSIATPVLRGVYDVVVRDTRDSSGTSSTTSSSVDCTGAACAVNVDTNTLTASFTGLSGVDVAFSVGTASDPLVSLTGQSDSAQAVLFASTGYGARANWAGLSTSAENIDLSSGDASVDFACSVTVQFDRNGVDVTVSEDETEHVVATLSGQDTSADLTLLAGKSYHVTLTGAAFPYPETRTISSCSGTVVSPLQMDPEMRALKAIYDACDGANWASWAAPTNHPVWTFPTGVSVCSGADTSDYYGVTCGDSVVKRLALTWNELDCPSGLPDEIKLLSFMQHLDVTGNSIRSLPPSLGDSVALKSLYAGYASLSGTIPTWLGNLVGSLQDLHLHGNQLNGAIPDELCALVNLQSFRVNHNDLSGNMPQCSGWTSLQELRIEYNSIGGPFPAWLMDCLHLKLLWCQSNEFTGSLPDTLSGLVHITTIDVSNNNLSGGVPDLTLLTTMSALKTDGNPEMTEETHCTTDTDGTQACETTAATHDNEDSSGSTLNASNACIMAAAGALALLG